MMYAVADALVSVAPRRRLIFFLLITLLKLIGADI
jgi:hypothetical protein